MPPDKIKSKDLSYTSELPPFLQRLHDQKAGRGDADRHEFQVARPKGKKNPDDDDGPTIVDESGENVSKEDFQKLGAAETVGNSVTGDVASEEPKGSSGLPDGDDARKGKENVTDGTAVKKRKVGKVVGDDEAEVETKDGEKGDAGPKKIVKKAKKKAKVKLTFDDGDEGS